MRITQQMPAEQLLQNVDQTLQRILSDQTQIATGNSLIDPASNPAAVSADLKTTSELAQTNQWTSVASSALSVAQATDTTLGQVIAATQSAYSLGVAANTPMSASSLTSLQAQIQAQMTNIGQLANTQVGNVYVLGGQGGTAPWSGGSSTTVIGAAAMNVQVGAGAVVQQNADGSSTVGGVLTALQGLVTVLGANQSAPGWETTMNTALGNLQTAMEGVQAQRAQFDAGAQTLTAAQTALQNSTQNLTQQQATLQNANIPAVVADLANQETAYKAILQTSTQVMLPSLANYLK